MARPTTNYIEIDGEGKWIEDTYAPGRKLPIIDLGTEYTEELKNDISSGKFEIAVVGGKLTINGHEYIMAHADYWLGTGSPKITQHHMMVIPANYIGKGTMNSSNTTANGYLGSDFKTGNHSNTALAKAKAQIIADFGAANILTHRGVYTNYVSGGAAAGMAIQASDVDLMNEVMVYGCNAFATGPGFELGVDKCQLKLFQERHDLITINENWWLRPVCSASQFAYVNIEGYADKDNATNPLGIRPAFAIF